MAGDALAVALGTRGADTAQGETARTEMALDDQPAREQTAEEPSKDFQEPKKPKEPRVSTTDHEARVMKMADGGFRPAYNAGLATDTASQVIVGVELTNTGSDQGQLAPMLGQIERRYDRAPGAVLVDGGFVNLAEIETLAGSACGTNT